MEFNSDQFFTAANAFIASAKRSSTSDEGLEVQFQFSIGIIESMQASPDQWDEKTEFNRHHIGDNLVVRLNKFPEEGIKAISKICIFAYRFLREFEFFISDGSRLSFELEELKSTIDNSLEKMDLKFRNDYLYASFSMPVEIIKRMVNNSGMKSFSDFNSIVERANETKENWIAEFEKQEEKIENIHNALKEYEIGFNFVGLAEGFENLKKDIIKRKNRLITCLIIFGVITLIPLVGELIYIRNIVLTGAEFSPYHLAILPTIIAIEALLIYFFRIFLHNLKEARTQEMQINLRQTLCQFIQSYADYSSKIKEKDSGALEKFENLIFSGIMADSEKLPSTYDGIEQITGLLKAAVGKTQG